MVKINSKKIENKISFFVQNLNSMNFQFIESEFKKLKDDKFLKNSSWVFRKRSFAQGKINKEKLLWNKSTVFFQSKKINTYVGGITRRFPKMSVKLKKFSEKIIIENLINKKILLSNFNFGVHAIRIICNKDNKGFPVPEGFHTDGVDFVAIIPVNQKNCTGGTSYLKSSITKKITLRNKISNGKFLFFNDKKFLHYASPIKHQKGKIGFRDMLVLTFIS
jgi:hypothetical protein|tara:strand:+ start:118 stop:777 length:660 start_codon:yes stop_codon:yes gene_type:complete